MGNASTQLTNEKALTGSDVRKMMKEKRTPIEIALDIDENGMTTAKKLYSFLELAPGNYARWCKANIVENEFAEENVDWWGFDIIVEGNKVADYRLSTTFAKKLSMQGKITLVQLKEAVA